MPNNQPTNQRKIQNPLKMAAEILKKNIYLMCSTPEIQFIKLKIKTFSLIASIENNL